MSVDLHLHTTFSDGALTPLQVVNIAHELNLKAIAITDHDTIDGIPEALQASSNHPDLEVIPGIELSTFLNNEEVHILGYYIDYKNPNLTKTLAHLQEEREERVIKIVNKLNELGINISYREVRERSLGKSIGRPHIATVLTEKGYTRSVSDAFSKYLVPGQPAYIPRQKISPPFAIDLIKQSHGIPVLAHPGLLTDQDIIFDLIKHGIMGIEVYHTDHSEDQTSYFEKLATNYNLLITGGSDCHGRDPLLIGTLPIPEKLIFSLKESRKKLRKYQK